MINVGILERRPIVRAGLELFLTGEPDLRFAGHTDEPGRVLSLAKGEGLQVLVCALSNAIDVLMETREGAPEMAVLLLSDGPPDGLAAKAIHLGAKGHIQTDARRVQFLAAIRAVAAGRTHLTAEQIKEAGGSQEVKAPHEMLSDREFQVFMKLAQGSNAAEVAKALGVSAKTVATYRLRMMEKMGMTSNSELTYYAMKGGLIE